LYAFKSAASFHFDSAHLNSPVRAADQKVSEKHSQGENLRLFYCEGCHFPASMARGFGEDGAIPTCVTPARRHKDWYGIVWRQPLVKGMPVSPTRKFAFPKPNTSRRRTQSTPM